MGFIKWAIVLAIGIFIGMSFASAVLVDDIVSYYKLDETTGAVVDELGTNDGTNYGSTRGETGIINYSFYFDGSNDYVGVPHDASLQITGNLSVSLWFYIDAFTTGNQIIEYRASGESEATNYLYSWLINSDGSASYGHEYGAGQDEWRNYNPGLNTGEWYHLAMVRDVNLNEYNIYLNGEESDTWSFVNDPSGGSSGSLRIGGDTLTGKYHDGRIDEAGIWDRVLTFDEVNQLYNSGVGQPYPFEGFVNLNSPPNDYTPPTTSVEFNATAVANDGETLVNMTLYHNASGTWTAIETQSITGTINTTNWTDTFSEENVIIWGVEACDTSACFFSVNRSLSIDMTNPIIDIITPVNGTLLNLLKEIGDTQDINYTIADTHLDTCWYEYNGVNTTFGTNGNCDGWLYSSDIEEEDLIAYYELDETTGVVVDELGTNNGTNSGATRGVAGIINDAFDFDGSNDYVDVTGISSDNTWSVSVWVNADNLVGTSKIFDCSTGRATFEYQTAQGGWLYYDTTYRAVGITEKFLDTWQHWVITQDGTDLEIYQNGSSIYSTTSAGKSLGGTCVLGKRYTGADYFDGTLDEIGIWDRQLSEAEIIELYNSGMGQRPIDTFTLENVGTLPWHELTIWANDTAGNVGSNYTIWEYDVFVTNQTWNNETSEGAVEPFTLNATLGTGLTFNSATLTYNGTDYAGTITNTGGTDYYIDTEIDISNVDAEEEREFYWNLALSNGESYNTSTQTQNVTALFIDDCTSFGTLILNYTLYDEDTQDLISPDPAVDNATIEINIDVSPLGSTTPIIEYSNTFETNNATICMDNLETNYRLDVTTKYSAFDHVVEYHHIQNYQLNSSSEQHISLYDLATTESQEFLVVFKDENFVLVQDALIDISREYVGEGLFKSVEVAKTDSQGQTIVHLVLGDVRYDIVVKKEGEILATFDNVVAVCQDAGSGECTLNLNQLATQVQPLDYENLGNIAYYWTLDRADRTIQVDFTSTDSLVVKVDLNVTKFDNYFNESVCDETLTSTTGTITCNIPANFGNVSFLAELYSDGEFVGQTLFSLSPQALESFGYTGVIMVIIMFMVLPLMFVSSPVGMVFGGIIAIVMMGLLSMFDYGGTLLGSGSMIMWFIVAGLILVWRMSKGGKSQ